MKNERPKYKCNNANCYKLLSKPGYCSEHNKVRDRFKKLDEKKTKEQKKFYSSGKWTKASKRHRAKEPLCRRCKSKGLVKPANLVHHNPELQYLLDNNLNPFDNTYLESLCVSCHNKELSAKRLKK